MISCHTASRSKGRLELLSDWSFVPLTVRITGVPSLTAVELNRIVRTTIDWSTGCFLDCPDLWAGTGGSIISLVLSVVAGPLPLKALVKRVKLILISATIAFTDKGKRCLVFVKGLTQFKCVLNSTIDQPVPLIEFCWDIVIGCPW